MVHLTERQLGALRDVRKIWPNANLLLIGAQALGAHIDMSYRDTDDLDLAVAVAMDEFPGALPDLPGWQPDEKMEHRFYSPEGQMVDVLPAGPELLAQGDLEWPSGLRMSLVGFDLAFAHAQGVTLDGVPFELPPACVLAFLKMRAWLDRPAERKKDLQDIAHLLESYVAGDDMRRWEDDVPEDIDFDDIPAFLLGVDLGAICEAHHLTHIAKFLNAVTPAKLAAQAQWFDTWVDRDESVERAEGFLTAFRRGIES